MLLFATGFGFKFKGQPVGIGFRVYEDKSKLFNVRVERVLDLKDYVK